MGKSFTTEVYHLTLNIHLNEVPKLQPTDQSLQEKSVCLDGLWHDFSLEPPQI